MIRIEYIEEADKYNMADLYTSIEMCDDASLTMAIKAFGRILNLATYHFTLDTLKSIVENLEDEGYNDNDRIM